MVRRSRKIVWTVKAVQSRKDIFDYWNNRNKSKEYSRKLNKLFMEALKLIASFPLSTVATQKEEIRLKLVSNYQLIYEITDSQIILHYIWDTRQNPKDFPIK